MKLARFIFGLFLVLVLQAAWFANPAHGKSVPSQPSSIHGGNLSVEVFGDGSYALRSTAIQGDVLRGEVQVDTAAGTLKSSLYPHHSNSIAPFTDELGSGHLLTVTHTGLPGTPDLICEFRVYDDQPWGDILVKVDNSTKSSIEIHAIRVLKTNAGAVVNLGGPSSADRVLSDNYTENPVQLMDLGEPENGVHLGVGSQLIYNRKSGQSLFWGALSADKLLTVFHLLSTTGPDSHLVSYDVADTGTNEFTSDQSHNYPPGNDVPLRLQAPAGTSVNTEPLMFAIGSDYHAQLENYGRAIRILHKALVTTPTPIGWWSWTAYYYGVTQNTVITNADWLAQNLKLFGYQYCFVDEGYQYARGEYATADGTAFPHGMGYVTRHAQDEGLTFGVWVAPFEMSELSYVYQHHKDWLVHNLAGEPIHLGKAGGRNSDELYALDPTNPGAQEYIRYTYSTLVKDWGVRLIKMDFMDTSAVEGVFYRPNTTALEALRIGLETIRSAVGDDVILDKDGSFMLTPVGLVNTGRIGQDTGHTFGSTREAEPGIAARYYMNRNFYLSDPDAFTVSRQVVNDRGWHGNKVPLTLEEAEDSIALAAVSGGMFEIGDDLPTLGASPDRMALVKNSDLLDMAKLSRASLPLDLMTYRPEDKQPSIFLLNETPRQQILTVFNWTTEPSNHTLALADLGLKASSSYTATDVLRGGVVTIENGALTLTLPPHSVRMVKLIDTSVPEADPAIEVHAPASGLAGDLVAFHGTAGGADAPVLQYHWDFGDGVSADGADVSHAYTHSGQYTVTATATGLNGRKAQKTLSITITGMVPTTYRPYERTRFNGTK
jgi:hypothetical protein